MRRRVRASAVALFIVLAPAAAASAVTLSGHVVDARSGEPIGKARVSIPQYNVEAVSDDAGRFSIEDLPTAMVELYVSTVGYGLHRQSLLPGALAGPVVVRLGQEAIQRAEEVTVAAAPFEHTEVGAVSEHRLDNSELKNLASVVADDALRSVQSLPGVTTGDDFHATFAVRGSGFASMGFYIDGVLTGAPFHTIRDIDDGFSLTILNGDLVDSATLLSSAPPAAFGDRTGAVLDVRTREPGRERRVTRASLGATGLAVTTEGPIGRRASGLLSARKSYLDYIVRRLDERPSFVLGWYDVQMKLAFEPFRAHQLTLLAIHGDAAYERNEDEPTRNGLATADSGTQIVNGAWRWLPSARASLLTRLYLDRETGRRRNRGNELLGERRSRHVGARSDLAVDLGGHHVSAGVFARRLAEANHERDFDDMPRTVLDYSSVAAQPSAYVQDEWRLHRRLTVTLGGRVEHLSATGETLWLPRAQAALAVTPSTSLELAWGDHGQFPSADALFGTEGNRDLGAARSRHAVAALEQRVGKMRLRVEGYIEDQDRFWFAPGAEFRRGASGVVLPQPSRLRNALHGFSRGLEVVVQRRSANGLSGWISYAWAETRLEGGGVPAFVSDFDQPHTVSAYGSWRLSSAWNVSAKYRYGRGTPIVGFYERRGEAFFLSARRNEARIEPYSRLDLRANRAFFFRRWTMTLYGEVMNVLDRKHRRYTGLDGIDLDTGRVWLDSDSMLPIVPAVGVAVVF
jgi:hypothetical protein